MERLYIILIRTFPTKMAKMKWHNATILCMLPSESHDLFCSTISPNYFFSIQINLIRSESWFIYLKTHFLAILHIFLHVLIQESLHGFNDILRFPVFAKERLISKQILPESLLEITKYSSQVLISLETNTMLFC